MLNPSVFLRSSFKTISKLDYQRTYIGMCQMEAEMARPEIQQPKLLKHSR